MNRTETQIRRVLVRHRRPGRSRRTGTGARALLPFGQPLRYSAVSPEIIERGLAEQMGPAVARGIARSYFWSAEHPHSTLFTGTSPELEPSLARPLIRLAHWARSQPWTERPAQNGAMRA